MAKLFGIAGKASGKMGSMVFRVRDGQQVVSQYNPIVKNPKSASQTNQRSSFKLMSQLAAIYADVLVFAPQGAKSARNQFVKKNFPLVTVTEGNANVQLANLALTSGSARPADYTVTRTSNNISAQTNAVPSGTYSKFIFILVVVKPSGDIAVVNSVDATATVADGNVTYAASFGSDYASENVVVYGYGVSAKSGKAEDAFGNINGSAATFIASLVGTRTLGTGDITVTRNLGLALASSENSGSTANFNQATVSVSTTGSGNVTGAGRYNVGSVCQLVATAEEGASFIGYYSGASLLSSNPAYQFTVSEDIVIEARFTAIAGKHTLTIINKLRSYDGENLPVEPEGASGEGQHTEGEQVYCVAGSATGYGFDGWYNENGQVLSGSNGYVYNMPGSDATLYAVWNPA